MQELELLKMLNFDSRIVQLYGACILEGCPVLVLEFMGVRLFSSQDQRLDYISGPYYPAIAAHGRGCLCPD